MFKAAITIAALIAVTAPSFAGAVTPHSSGPIPIPYPRVTVPSAVVKPQLKVGPPVSGARGLSVEGESTPAIHHGVR